MELEQLQTIGRPAMNMFVPRTLNLRLCALITAAFTLAAAAAPQPTAIGAAQRGGIWKAAVPPKPMRGEFGSFDPIGVAAGVRIRADCSLNWIDPDDGKRYCFASGTSLEFFLDMPQTNLERARASWRRMTSRHPAARP
jgi:hypothetical protein